MNKSKSLIGQRFGAFTVVKFHGQSDGARRCSEWLCRCDCGNEVVYKQQNISRYINSGKMVSCEQCMNNGDQSSENEEGCSFDLNDLYQYVENKVLNLSDGHKLNKTMKTKLNNLCETYSIDIVMNTFKDSNTSIQKAFRNNRFNDEKHCFNYAFKSVQNNIKRISSRANKPVEPKETNEVNEEHIEIKGLDLSDVHNYVNNYKKRDLKLNPLFDNLWCNNGIIN